MATGRNLRVNFTGVLSADYLRTDNTLNTENIQNQLRYTGLQDIFENGVEADQADLMYHNERTFTPATENIDLDNVLQNVFGDYLNFYTVKAVVIKNKHASAFLTFAIKSETGIIGPDGRRLIWEPKGLFTSGASSPGLVGNLVLSGSVALTYDLIIIGNSSTVNTSSSG